MKYIVTSLVLETVVSFIVVWNQYLISIHNYFGGCLTTISCYRAAVLKMVPYKLKAPCTLQNINKCYSCIHFYTYKPYKILRYICSLKTPAVLIANVIISLTMYISSTFSSRLFIIGL